MPDFVDLMMDWPAGLRCDLSDRELRAFCREEARKEAGDLAAAENFTQSNLLLPRSARAPVPFTGRDHA